MWWMNSDLLTVRSRNRVTLQLAAVLLGAVSCAGRPSTPASPPAGERVPEQSAREQPVREQFEAKQTRVATDPAFSERAGELPPGPPLIPEYPGAERVGSAERSRPGAPNAGVRMVWRTKDSVAKVMAWYQKTLQDQKWDYDPPSDGVALAQLAGIRKGNLDGYVEAEADDGFTEIVVVIGPRK